jgi:hypothetical protein
VWAPDSCGLSKDDRASVFAFSVAYGRIVASDMVADPERLRHLDITALD